MRINRSSVNGAISLRHKLKNNILGNLVARSISANYTREARFSDIFPANYIARIRIDVYYIRLIRVRDAFERTALLIRRATGDEVYAPRIGWLFTRHYQVYQMLMRGEARYSSIRLNRALRRSSLTPGRNLQSQISTIQFAVAILQLHKRLRSALLILRYRPIHSTFSFGIRPAWHESKMNSGLIARCTNLVLVLAIPLKEIPNICGTIELSHIRKSVSKFN